MTRERHPGLQVVVIGDPSEILAAVQRATAGVVLPPKLCQHLTKVSADAAASMKGLSAAVAALTAKGT